MSLADEYKEVQQETDTSIEKVTEGDGYPVTIVDYEFKKSKDKKEPMVVLVGKITPTSKADKKAFGEFKGKKIRKYHVMTNPYAKKGLYRIVVELGGDLSEMETLSDIEDFLDGLDSKPKGRMYYDKPEGSQYPDTLILFGFDHNGKPVPDEKIKEKEEDDDDDEGGVVAPD